MDAANAATNRMIHAAITNRTITKTTTRTIKSLAIAIVRITTQLNQSQITIAHKTRTASNATTVVAISPTSQLITNSNPETNKAKINNPVINKPDDPVNNRASNKTSRPMKL